MTSFGSWRLWVILALALTTLACAGKAERRERKEEARQERAERREQAKQERAQRNESRRAERDGRAVDEPKVAPIPVSAAPVAATLEAKMIFMRATSFGGAIAASVFDVTEPGDPKFIGIINRGNKLVYPVKPGHYTFMVVSEAADFMQATIVGGKSYYALVTPRMGVWKARFSFKPVRGDELNGSQFASWDRGTRPVSNTPKNLAWARDNASDVADKRNRYYPEWSSKSQSEREQQTLRAEDGR